MTFVPMRRDEDELCVRTYPGKPGLSAIERALRALAEVALGPGLELLGIRAPA